MAEQKFRFNPKTLAYERVQLSTWQKVKRTLLFLTPGVVVGLSGIALAYVFVDSPKEAFLKQENKQLIEQYELMNRHLNDIEQVIADVRRRDDNIYRVIFEADPIPEAIRQAGVGGVNRYRQLEGFASSALVKDTRQRLDQLAKQLYVQSVSLDEVADMAMRKQDMLASIPAIQPVSNDDLTRVASGFGERVHPIHKIVKFHAGMDFTAPIGTEIYSTGDGKVIFADFATNGYGIHVVIDHGWDYQTLYAHLDELKVRTGQKVKRGDVIGLVGNTGLSAGPHLHYEVHKGGEAIDPANYYFNDLSPQEYSLMLQLSANANQSLD